MPNKRKYISTEYGIVNLRDGDTILHLDPELLADMFWRVLDGKITEVVRCKDCKYYNEYPSGFGCCEIHKGSIAIQTPLTFCAWGEREEDDRD